VLLALALSSVGCSFAFSKGPPDDYKAVGHFDCSGNTAPLFDSAWAVYNGLTAMYAAADRDRDWKLLNHRDDRSTVIRVGLAWLAVSGASAVYGYLNASACQDAKEETEEMLVDEMARSRSRRRVRPKPPEAPSTPPAASDAKVAAPAKPPEGNPPKLFGPNDVEPFRE
jgi:hypothetical protein